MTESNDPGDVTILLQQWRAGSELALEQLTPIVYEELRRRAGAAFRAENAGHTLQPTALVNELYARLTRVEVDWQDRTHFFALCSRMMRRLLVDHAKSARTHKRGGQVTRVQMDTGLGAATPEYEELLGLDRALEKLAAIDARKAELVDMQVFGGLSFQEMAEVTGLSSSTIDRDLRFARAWLKTQLSGA